MRVYITISFLISLKKLTRSTDYRRDMQTQYRPLIISAREPRKNRESGLARCNKDADAAHAFQPRRIPAAAAATASVGCAASCR